jgi:hypothetical protein
MTTKLLAALLLMSEAAFLFCTYLKIQLGRLLGVQPAAEYQ